MEAHFFSAMAETLWSATPRQTEANNSAKGLEAVLVWNRKVNGVLPLECKGREAEAGDQLGTGSQSGWDLVLSHLGKH